MSNQIRRGKFEENTIHASSIRIRQRKCNCKKKRGGETDSGKPSTKVDARIQAEIVCKHMCIINQRSIPPSCAVHLPAVTQQPFTNVASLPAAETRQQDGCTNGASHCACRGIPHRRGPSIPRLFRLTSTGLFLPLTGLR